MDKSERISKASKVAMILSKHTSYLGLKFNSVEASYEIVDKLMSDDNDN